jgi:hypothetical protein
MQKSLHYAAGYDAGANTGISGEVPGKYKTSGRLLPNDRCLKILA